MQQWGQMFVGFFSSCFYARQQFCCEKENAPHLAFEYCSACWRDYISLYTQSDPCRSREIWLLVMRTLEWMKLFCIFTSLKKDAAYLINFISGVTRFVGVAFIMEHILWLFNIFTVKYKRLQAVRAPFLPLGLGLMSLSTGTLLFYYFHIFIFIQIFFFATCTLMRVYLLSV